MENILTTMARQFLPQMEPEERAEALRSLKRMIDEEFFAMAVAESGDETARYMECPRCGSALFAARMLIAARMLGRPYAFREGDYAKAVIATVPTTMSKRPREVLRDSRSPRTSHANAIEATIESLSTCTTTLTTPVCSA